MGKVFDAKIAKLATYLAAFLAAILISKNAYAETPTLSFSASSASNGGVVEMETLAPTSTSGAYTSGSDTLSIATTCSAGHSVYVSATSDGGTSLDNADKTSNIPTDSFTLGSSGLGNIWGIRYGSGNDYIALPAYSSDISGDITPIYTGTNTTIPIYYGINVTPTLAPGEYSGKVLYTVLMASECEKPDEPEPEVVTFADVSVEAGVTTMQDFTPEMCEKVTIGQTTSLVDNREGAGGKRTYAIKKLKDGNCWMTMNLALYNYTMTSIDSNVSSDFKLPASSTSGFWTDTADAAKVYYAKEGSTSNIWTKNSNGAVPEETVYYNFYATTAGFSYLNDGKTYSSLGGTLDTASSHYDVCPAGWRLPTGGENGDFATLDKAVNGEYDINAGTERTEETSRDRLVAEGIFAYAGYINNAYINHTNISGRWWTSTVYTSKDGYAYYIHSSGLIGPQWYADKYRGYAVRCLKETRTINDITYMQEASPAIVRNTASGATGTLKDSRDNQSYGVYKIPTDSQAADVAGKYLMTKDLNIGYVTGGSIVQGSDLVLTTGSSAGSGAVLNRTSPSDWSESNTVTNYQYANNTSSQEGHAYYTWGAAQIACPNGWRPPSVAQYRSLITLVGSLQNFLDNPYDFKLTGYWNAGGTDSRGWNLNNTYSMYWSADEDRSLYLRTSTTPYISSNFGKAHGLSVRCIAD